MDGLGGARVTELWRYPVKSMRGERVDASEVGPTGLQGDRAYAVVDVETGKVGSAKHPRLWADLLRCSRGSASEPTGDAVPTVVITLPDGAETASDAPDVDDRLSAVFDRPVRLTDGAPEGSTYLAVWPEIEGVIPEDFLAQNSVTADEAEGALTDIGLALAAPGTFFDVSALHVVTEATLRRLGELAPDSEFAVERYRPNLVLDSPRRAVRRERLGRQHLHRRRGARGDGAAPDHALHHDDARAGRPSAATRTCCAPSRPTTGSTSRASAPGRASAPTPR